MTITLYSAQEALGVELYRLRGTFYRDMWRRQRLTRDLRVVIKDNNLGIHFHKSALRGNKQPEGKLPTEYEENKAGSLQCALDGGS